MSDDDQNGGDPNPSDKTPFGPGSGKSLLARMLAEHIKKQLKELGVSGPPVLKIRPADCANVFTGHTDLEIGAGLEAAKRLVEAEGHQVILILDEVDALNLDEMDDEEEAEEP